MESSHYQGAPALVNASERQEALRRYHILDTPPERNFDQVTRLVAQVCEVPTALITLLDEERQWFKSCFGYDQRETDIEVSFCAHAVHERETLVVEDATQDPRFKDNPLVTGESGWRFYAGAPLRTPEGIHVGTLCIVDYEPRVFDAGQRAILEDLADMVIGQFELRSAEAQYRKLFKGNPQPTFIYDIDTLEVLDANAAAMRTYGYEREMRTLTLPDLVAPASLDDHTDRSTDGTAPFTARHRRSDGTHLSVEVREESLLYQGRQARVATMIDVADRTRGRQYERLVENVQEIVFETDLEGQATFLNSAWEEVTGFSKEEALGDSLLHYVHPKDRVDSLQAFAPLLQRRQDLFRHRTRFLTRDGEELTMQFRARLITGEDGTPVGTVGTLTPLEETVLEETGKETLPSGDETAAPDEEAVASASDDTTPLEEETAAVDEAKPDEAAAVDESEAGEPEEASFDEPEDTSPLQSTARREDEEQAAHEPAPEQQEAPQQQETTPDSFSEPTSDEPTFEESWPVPEEDTPPAEESVSGSETDSGSEADLVEDDAFEDDAFEDDALEEADEKADVPEADTFGAEVFEPEASEETLEHEATELADGAPPATPADSEAAPSPDTLRKIVYVSRAARPLTSDDLRGLLREAREKNKRLGVTGMLLYKQQTFMQVLEGPADVVEPLYETIRADERHEDVEILTDESVEQREFTDWAMGFRHLDDQEAERYEGFTDFMDVEATMQEFAQAPGGVRQLLLHFEDHPLPALDDEVHPTVEGKAEVKETLSEVRDRLSEDPPRLRVPSLNFFGYVHQVLNRLEPAARRKGLTLNRAIPRASASVKTDEGGLRLLIDALVSNAIAATEEGAVTVSASAEDEEVRLRVEDSSTSISKGLLDSLLSIGSSKQEDEEDGQHMAFVHRLVNILQGSVEVEGQRDQGTVFTVTLPRELDVGTDEKASPESPSQTWGPPEVSEESPSGFGEEEVDDELFASVDAEETSEEETLAPPTADEKVSAPPPAEEAEHTEEPFTAEAADEETEGFAEEELFAIDESDAAASDTEEAAPDDASVTEPEETAEKADLVESSASSVSDDPLSEGFPELDTLEEDTTFAEGETLADIRERLSTDPPQLRTASIDFAEHLRTTLDELEPAARRKGLMMHRALPEGDASIEADSGALRLLLAALVNNAIAATEEGSITVSGRVEEDDVRLRVVDTGADISKSLLNSLLNVDVAEEEDEEQAHEQHMAFVHRLVNLMQGSVEMESQRGQGTVFTVTLPRHPVPTPDVATPEAAPTAATEEAVATEEEVVPEEADEVASGSGDGADEWLNWNASDWEQEEAPAEEAPAAEPATEAEHAAEADASEGDSEDFSWKQDSIFSTSPESEEEPPDDPDAFRSDPDSPFSF